jgi:hypothetical protein
MNIDKLCNRCGEVEKIENMYVCDDCKNDTCGHCLKTCHDCNEMYCKTHKHTCIHSVDNPTNEK